MDSSLQVQLCGQLLSVTGGSNDDGEVAKGVDGDPVELSWRNRLEQWICPHQRPFNFNAEQLQRTAYHRWFLQSQGGPYGIAFLLLYFSMFENEI